MNSPIANYKNLHVDPANLRRDSCKQAYNYVLVSETLILVWIRWNNDQIPQQVDKFPDPLPAPRLWWKPSGEYFVRW